MLELIEHMAKTKTPIKKVRHRMQLASILFSFLSFLLLFFELMLTMHGGWDDLNFYVISLIPVVAALGGIIAMVNTVKFRSKSRDYSSSIHGGRFNAILLFYDDIRIKRTSCEDIKNTPFRRYFLLIYYKLASTAAQVASALSAGIMTVTWSPTLMRK